MGDNSPIDMSKLTQRELLILLNQQVKSMNDKLNNVADDHINLRERVSNIETRHNVIAAAWGVGTIAINIFLNAFKILK
jgi:hypothetical protein